MTYSVIWRWLTLNTGAVRTVCSTPISHLHIMYVTFPYVDDLFCDMLMTYTQYRCSTHSMFHANKSPTHRKINKSFESHTQYVIKPSPTQSKRNTHCCTLCTKKSSESQDSFTLSIACNVTNSMSHQIVTNSMRHQISTSAVRTAASFARKSHLDITYSFTLNISCDVTNSMSHQIITNSMRHQIIMSSTPAQYTLLHPRTPAQISHLNITKSTSRYSLTLNESSNHYQRNVGAVHTAAPPAPTMHLNITNSSTHSIFHCIVTKSMRIKSSPTQCFEREREGERAKGRESDRERERKGERAKWRESERERERKGERARARAHSYVWHEVSRLTLTNTMQARYTLLHPPHQMLGPPSQISEDAVIFANFNQLFKVDPETAHVW